MHHAKLARVFPLLLRMAAFRRTPRVLTICRKVEQWLLDWVDNFVVLYIGGDAGKGEIECAAIERR
jgi:hypothetical protein